MTPRTSQAGAEPPETRTTALERAIADACLGEHAGDTMAHDLRGFLEAHGVAIEDIEAILKAPPRLAVYRTLVRNGLDAVIARMLPRTRARMNAACSGRFDVDVARFLAGVGPRTHYLRDVPRELFAWAEPRWRNDPRVPGYLPDLAAHELSCFTVAAEESGGHDDPPHGGDDVTLDRSMAFDDSARLMRYGWAVHELPADEDATNEPSRREVRLLAYRDSAHAVRWLELTPLAASTVERLMVGEPLGLAVERACADHSTAPRAVAADVARLLADLSERGVLLGARGRERD
jgi:uncharacterized protein